MDDKVDDNDNEVNNNSKNDIHIGNIEKIKQELLADDNESDPNFGDNNSANKENSDDDNDNIVVNHKKELDFNIGDRDYAEFVINIIKKTVKQEDSLVRQIFYCGLSAYTNDPINLGIIAPTSEGKTYPVIESLKPFPKEDVWLIGSMSTKLLVRQKGVLVDKNNEPLKPKIKELKKEIANTKEKEKQEELKEQLEELYENARTLIDLRGKILVFLEPPQHELWNLLKPILSHDDDEIEFPFVDKTERGFQPKRIVVKGWPACIFCSAKDESEWPVWPEIVSRFLITSPNMNTTKYRESNLLIAQRKGLPSSVQQRIIVSNEEIRLAKLCALYLKQQIQKLLLLSGSLLKSTSNNSNNPVWIPYTEILAEVLPAEKGTDTRVSKRIFSLLQIIPLTKAHLRQKLILGTETLIIASLEDLGEVLHISQNISGMPSYKLKFFKEIFLPLYRLEKRKSSHDEEEGGHKEQEKIIGVTTKQLCDYFKQEKSKTITTNNLKKTYLNELINNGYIDEVDSEIDKRQRLYYPLIDFPLEYNNNNDYEKMKNCRTLGEVDNYLRYPMLLFPENCRNIPENWLKFEILDLIKYPLKVGKFALLDKDGNDLCVCRFEKEYEKTLRLSGYFLQHKMRDNVHKVFGDIKYLGDIDQNQYEKLSTQGQVLQFSILGDSQNEQHGSIGRFDANFTKQKEMIDNNSNYQQQPLSPSIEGMQNEINNGDESYYQNHQNRSQVLANTNTSYMTNNSSCSKKQQVEDFFYEDPSLPYEPLPFHSLEASPCYSIVGIKRKLYYCKLHPEARTIYLESIEQHCKYKEPDLHKAEILLRLSEEEDEKNDGNEDDDSRLQSDKEVYQGGKEKESEFQQ